MKVLWYILLVVPVLLMASNCPNKKNKEPNVIKGRLMYGCDTPAPNVPLMLKAGSKFVETVDGLKEIYTDEDGYFEFKFQPVMSWYTLMSSPQKIMHHIPNQDYLDLGEVNWNATVNFIIKLQVNNPYTENDTLFLRDWNSLNPSDQLKISGPFESGIIDTAVNVGYFQYPVAYISTPQLSINYYFSSYAGLKWARFSTPFCTNDFAEATLVID